MTGVSHYLPSMRRRNGLGDIFEGHEAGARSKLQELYLANMEAKAMFNGGLEESLCSLPNRQIDREEILQSARYRERRNAIVSVDMEITEGPQWREIIKSLADTLPEVQQAQTSSQMQPLVF